MGKGFFNHSSSNKKQLLDIDGNNLSISGGNTVQLPLGGEANFNGFFPNGYELILESRDFLQSDVGKLLILGGSPVELTMPNTMPFEVGDIIGITSVQSSNNYQPAYDEDKIFPNHHGAGIGEVLILQCEDFTSLGGIKMLFPISTTTIYDSKDNNVKTLYRYILDNLGNTGILFPNGFQALGSGEYEYTADMAGKMIFISNGTKLIKPLSGYPFQNGDLICVAPLDSDTEGTFSSDNQDNIKLLNREYIILYALDIGGGTINLLPFSTPIIQDGEDENTNPIWKTNNRYFYDNRSPYRTITLGTVTYEDINNAPADSEIEINVGLTPPKSFIDKYIITISSVGFDSFQVSQIEGIKIGYQLKDTVFDGINNLSASTYNYTFPNNNGQVVVSGNGSFVILKINFDKGAGEINPQNFTQGEFTIKAIIGTIE